MMNLPNDGRAGKNERTLRRHKGAFKELGVLLTLGILCVFIGLMNPVFFSGTNLISVLRQISLTAIMSVGMVFVVITGGIDLSVGSFLSFGGIACASMAMAGVNPWLSLLITLALCIGLGLATGIVVVRLKINPFIVTLAMLNIVAGITYMISKAMPVKFQNEVSVLGGSLGGVFPMPIVLMIIIVLIGIVVLTRTVFGRHVFAVGANEKGARLSGVNVNSVKAAVYAISALLSGFCGIVAAGNYGSAVANAGTGEELDVIAAAVIGGCSLSGGRGSVWGALIGAAILGVIRNGFVLLKISSYWQSITIGLIIIAACAIDNIRNNKE